MRSPERVQCIIAGLTKSVWLARSTPARPAAERFRGLALQLDEASRAAYRELVESAGFDAWFGQVSPIEELSRLRECASETCQWLFLDRSKSRTRRWCDMRDCGNRAKARRFYERTTRAKRQARS